MTTHGYRSEATRGRSCRRSRGAGAVLHVAELRVGSTRKAVVSSMRARSHALQYARVRDARTHRVLHARVVNAGKLSTHRLRMRSVASRIRRARDEVSTSGATAEHRQDGWPHQRLGAAAASRHRLRLARRGSIAVAHVRAADRSRERPECTTRVLWRLVGRDVTHLGEDVHTSRRCVHISPRHWDA